MNHIPTVLVIDDDARMAETISHLLGEGYSVHTASSGPEGIERAQAIRPDLILLDLKMPQMSGMTVLKRLKEMGNDIPVIIMTAYGRVDSAVQAMKLGAIDFIEKPFSNERLKEKMRHLFAERKGLEDLPSRQGIIGKSPQIQEVWRLVERFGPTDLPILLQGETGTGKELFARAIHEISKRGQGPFVPIDCFTLPDSLIESEVFGYERGAFTGAFASKLGRLEWANGGTLLLDEVGNLPLSFQAKLLRVIQERKFSPLGARGSEMKSLDVRLISTTNIDLEEAIRQGRFREDLYYRLSGVTIKLPPLKEREGDVELLAHHFVQVYGRRYGKPGLEISEEALKLLTSYPWPGNVREMEHAIGSAVIMAEGVILPKHLPPHFKAMPGDAGKELHLELSLHFDGGPTDLKRLMKGVTEKAEGIIISEVARRVKLNQMELARFLHIDPKTLRNKLRRKDVRGDTGSG